MNNNNDDTIPGFCGKNNVKYILVTQQNNVKINHVIIQNQFDCYNGIYEVLQDDLWIIGRCQLHIYSTDFKSFTWEKPITDKELKTWVESSILKFIETNRN